MSSKKRRAQDWKFFCAVPNDMLVTDFGLKRTWQNAKFYCHPQDGVLHPQNANP
jgi:hypothetical protein